MATKIKNPLLTKERKLPKSDRATIRRMARYGISHWSNLAIPIVKKNLETLGIGGEGFCDLIPKKRLPFGDGCVLGCVVQEGVEVAKITSVFFFQKGQATAWVECFFKGQSVDQKKFILMSPIQFESEIQGMARALQISLDMDREKQQEERVG